MVNEYMLPYDIQMKFLEIENEILDLEGTPEKKLDLSILETKIKLRRIEGFEPLS